MFQSHLQPGAADLTLQDSSDGLIILSVRFAWEGTGESHGWNAVIEWRGMFRGRELASLASPGLTQPSASTETLKNVAICSTVGAL